MLRSVRPPSSICNRTGPPDRFDERVQTITKTPSNYFLSFFVLYREVRVHVQKPSQIYLASVSCKLHDISWQFLQSAANRTEYHANSVALSCECYNIRPCKCKFRANFISLPTLTHDGCNQCANYYLLFSCGLYALAF